MTPPRYRGQYKEPIIPFVYAIGYDCNDARIKYNVKFVIFIILLKREVISDFDYVLLKFYLADLYDFCLNEKVRYKDESLIS